MEFREIAQKLGFETYPEELDAIYTSMDLDNTPACDLEVIDRLQKEMDFFGGYYDVVRQTAEAINVDPLRSVWVKVASKFAAENPTAIAKKVPTPVADGTAVTDLLPLYILLTMVPDAIREYERLGFTREEIVDLMNGFKGGIAIVESQVGRPCINALYYGWLMIYVKVEIFVCGGFWFQLATINPRAMWLRNRQSGEVLCVMCKGTFDETGSRVKGSKFFEEPENPFTVTLTEDDEKFVGHGVYDNKVSPVAQTYLKSQWECIARPGDKCMNLHIPRNTDISQEALNQAVADARIIAEERFPGKAGAQIHCSSWILSPKLAELLGPDARITQFLERFVKHPQVSQGKELFGYVFPKNCDDYSTLPEDTTLQRKLKKLYMEGGCSYGCAGLLV